MHLVFMLFILTRQNWVFAALAALYLTLYVYVSVHNQLYMVMFCLKKLISPHTGLQIPPTLAQITLTHSTSMSELLADHIAPPGGQI